MVTPKFLECNICGKQQPYEAFIAVTLLYVMINVTVMYLMRRVEKTVQVPGFVGGK